MCVGHEEGVKGWLFYDPKKSYLFVSRDAVFHEETPFFNSTGKTQQAQRKGLVIGDETQEEEQVVSSGDDTGHEIPDGDCGERLPSQRLGRAHPRD